jgi:predicted nucleic acid-binding Zn ribbon protein
MAQRLAEIIFGLDTGVAKAVKACTLLRHWDGVVDEQVRKHTEAVKISNRTLYIKTSSPAWAQELSFLKSEIITKFNQQAGEEAIKDIRFKSGG